MANDEDFTFRTVTTFFDSPNMHSILCFNLQIIASEDQASKYYALGLSSHYLLLNLTFNSCLSHAPGEEGLLRNS